MDNKSKIVIFCESYPSIAYTLYRLTNENRDVPATIFFPVLKDLYSLFQVINEKVFNNNLELIYFPEYVHKWTKTRGIKSVNEETTLIFFHIAKAAGITLHVILKHNFPQDNIYDLRGLTNPQSVTKFNSLPASSYNCGA